jgi:hypothetical protein
VSFQPNGGSLPEELTFSNGFIEVPKGLLFCALLIVAWVVWITFFYMLSWKLVTGSGFLPYDAW